MNAGRLDSKIVIQSASLTTNGLGVQTESWSTIATEWAEVRHLKGQEYEQAQQIAGETDTKFIIRYNSNSSAITQSSRIQFGSEDYDILESIPIPGGRPTKLEIYARRRTTDV